MGCDLASGCYIFPSSWSARASAFPAPSFISWSFLAGRRRWPPSIHENTTSKRKRIFLPPFSHWRTLLFLLNRRTRTHILYIQPVDSNAFQAPAPAPAHPAPRPIRHSEAREKTSHHLSMMQQHNTTRSTSTTKLSSSASSAMAAKGKRGVINLQGPRPPPLTILPSGTTSSSPHPRPAKRPRRVVNVSGSGSDDNDVREPPALAATPGPLILYEHTPKVIHARADEFKALVQSLTGRGGGQEAVPRPPASSQQTAAGDLLVLTLGHHQHVPPPPPLPSPGGAAGFLLSPGSFLFSPATMQAIQELIS